MTLGPVPQIGTEITSAITVLAADTELPEPVASGWRLVVAALAGIAVIVVLITVAKLHPFLALIFGALTVGIVAGVYFADVLGWFSDGFGTTAAGVGILIALGAMFAKILADSGGADVIVDTIVGHSSPRALPWAMALVGSIIGLPMFFEIGLVLLMPVIYLVARRSGQSLITIGIPALAGLSAMHGLVPPHPGPLTAIDLLGADLGITLALGVAVAIPTVIVAGPLFGKLAGRWVVVDVPDRFNADDFAIPAMAAQPLSQADRRLATAPRRRAAHRPSFGITMFSVLLPVVLMMGKALVDIFIEDENNLLRQTFDILGTTADRAADRRHRRDVHPRPRRRDDPRSDREMHRDVAAPGRGHHPDRRGGRRVQAGAGRHRHRHHARRTGPRAPTSR